jgi:hypothetical protein
VFDCKEVPSISLKFLNKDSIRVHGGRLIGCWRQNAIVKFSFVKVAFEASKACRKTVEEHRQVVLVLHLSFRHHRRHIEPETSSETFIEVPGLYTFCVQQNSTKETTEVKEALD